MELYKIFMKSNKHFLRIIKQTKYVLIRKSITEWKKFQKKVIECKLVNYKNYHIYRIIIFKRTIKRYLKVRWINNLLYTISFVINDENFELFAKKFRTDDDINVSLKQFLNCIWMLLLQNVKIFQFLKIFTSEIMLSK